MKVGETTFRPKHNVSKSRSARCDGHHILSSVVLSLELFTLASLSNRRPVASIAGAGNGKYCGPNIPPALWPESQRRRAWRSRQISAIVSNASSSLDFFDRRSFSLGSFCLGGNVLLAGAAFDAFVAVAGRDLRFGAIVCGRVAGGVQGFWSGSSIIPSAATLPVLARVLASELSGTAGEHHGRSSSDAVHVTAGPRPF